MVSGSNDSTRQTDESTHAYVIRDGDLLLVPEGYHVFAVAQGYTGYYLNILAGNEPIRTMQPIDDPAFAWVRNNLDTGDERRGDLLARHRGPYQR